MARESLDPELASQTGRRRLALEQEHFGRETTLPLRQMENTSTRSHLQSRAHAGSATGPLSQATPILTSTGQMALDGAEAVSVRSDSGREAGRGPGGGWRSARKSRHPKGNHITADCSSMTQDQGQLCGGASLSFVLRHPALAQCGSSAPPEVPSHRIGFCGTCQISKA